MKILLLNQDWFKEEFQAAGHEVRSCGTAQHLDAVLPRPCMHISTVLHEHLDDFAPDVIVWLDNSAPLTFLGLAETGIPTVMYSVDTHHHAAVHRYLAHIFDVNYVAQKDYLPLFHEVGSDAAWMPLYASRYVEPSSDKEHGAVFVGNLNPRLNPGRVKFFEALTQAAPVLTTTGEYWKIFPHSEIVINQTVKGDLNFRLFEAMMCGALLLTERSGNGLLELFEDGRHLITYEKDNVEEAASKIQECLSNLERTHRIAAEGREEILRNHLPRHRAEVILKDISSIQKKNSPSKFFSQALIFSIASRTLEQFDAASAAKALIEAMKSLNEGINRGETLLPEVVSEAVYSCTRYDQVFSSSSGANTLLALAEAHPDVFELSLAKVRCLFNSGDAAGANKLAASLSPGDPGSILKLADEFVCSILAHCKSLNLHM